MQVANLAMHQAERYEAVFAILGGDKVLGRPPLSVLDVHRVASTGMPREALLKFIGNFRAVEGELIAVLGISRRTFQRYKLNPEKVMSTHLASRIFVVAEAMLMAWAVLGGRTAMERWLVRPAMGLDGERPIDFLATAQGVEVVTDFLLRLEYCVYT